MNRMFFEVEDIRRQSRGRNGGSFLRLHEVSQMVEDLITSSVQSRLVFVAPSRIT